MGYAAGELVCGEEPLDKASTSQGMLGKLNVGGTNATTHETVAVSDATVIGEVLSTVYVASDMAANSPSTNRPAPVTRQHLARDVGRRSRVPSGQQLRRVWSTGQPDLDRLI